MACSESGLDIWRTVKVHKNLRLKPLKNSEVFTKNIKKMLAKQKNLVYNKCVVTLRAMMWEVAEALKYQ